MTEYAIFFNDEWVGEWTDEEMHAKSAALRPLIAGMREQGVLLFTGGLDNEAACFSVSPNGGEPVFSDGPFAETKEHFGGLAVIDVETEDEARHWAGLIAEACGWPQEVRPFQVPMGARS
jgi:hypothetical protein